MHQWSPAPWVSLQIHCGSFRTETNRCQRKHLRYEEAAHQRGKVIVIAVRQNTYKRFGVSANYVHQAGMRTDGGFSNSDTGAANPQSAYSEQGEYSRTDWETPNIFFLMGNVKLPLKGELSTLANARSGRPLRLEHLVKEFANSNSGEFECSAPFRRRGIDLPSSAIDDFYVDLEPTPSLHTVKQRIDRSRSEPTSMPA